MTSWDYAFLGTMFVLFMANTILQYRYGFKQGSHGGYSVGMYHAIQWLMKNEALEVDNKTTGRAATAAEVVVYILSKTTSDNFSKMSKEDSEAIALASAQKDEN